MVKQEQQQGGATNPNQDATIFVKQSDPNTIVVDEQLPPPRELVVDDIIDQTGELEQTDDLPEWAGGKNKSRKTKSRKTKSRKTKSRKTKSRKTKSRKTNSRKTNSRKTKSRKMKSRKTKPRKMKPKRILRAMIV
jgi:hypothetical protein